MTHSEHPEDQFDYHGTSITSDTTGLVSKIVPQSFVDGPGNRTTIFLQGCSLNCLFCHNPQTINFCKHCGICVSECPHGALDHVEGRVFWNPASCCECDTCIQVCPHDSSPKATQISAQQLWVKIQPYIAFISGITVSGGEPTLQLDFVGSLFALVKQNSQLTTLVQTNGVVPWERMQKYMPWIDLVMVDLKVFNSNLHKRLTGQDNHQVKEIIHYLAKEAKLYSVRTTVVPGYSDSIENAIQTAQFIAQIDPNIRLRFQRFRPHGTRGEASGWQMPTDSVMDQLVEAAYLQGVLDVSRSL